MAITCVNLLCARHYSKCFTYKAQLILTIHVIGTHIVCSSQTRMRQREVKHLAQDFINRKFSSWDSKPGNLVLESNFVNFIS